MVRAYLFLAVLIPLTILFSVSAIVSTLFDSSGRAYALHARLWARLGPGDELSHRNAFRNRASSGWPGYLHE